MSKGKILLVDDNLDMLLIGQRIFSRAEYLFASARTGQEGLEKAKSEPPNAIILDYILPDMNGSDFIKEINKHETLNRVPIVILTARADTIDDLESLFAMGLRAFLNKPFGHRELVNVIENIIMAARFTPANKMTASSSSPTPEIDSEWLSDLRTAASTIATLCQELNSKNDKNLSDEQRLDLQAIYSSSKRLLKLLKNRPSSGESDERLMA
ncbi:response regulator [candidate division KSB1 bacterium]|jgi:DNA-binding response OmpR family regulator|nr:response regulator [candidate division KSB1 bacterium]